MNERPALIPCRRNDRHGALLASLEAEARRFREQQRAEQPRLFHLQRDRDVSGVSGTGRVADGVLWPDGTVTIRWRGDRPSTVHWDALADAEAVHGHGGATRIVWADEEPSVNGAAT